MVKGKDYFYNPLTHTRKNYERVIDFQKVN